MLNPNSAEAALQRLVDGEELLDVLEKPSTKGTDRLGSERENYERNKAGGASSP